MRTHNLAFIDIETTGLNFFKHEIIEIGCVLTTPSLEVIEEFELKIKPQKIENADPVALKITHYNEEDWKSGSDLQRFAPSSGGFRHRGHAHPQRASHGDL